MKKLGIFGGTFDPIHFGHLRPALEILQALSLDEIRFIPAARPPHRGAPVAPADLRLAMVEAAVTEEARFSVDARELHRKGPSYTVDTLKDLRNEFPKESLVLMVGMDAFLGFTGWHRWQDILGLAHVVVAHRPGWTLPVDGIMVDTLRTHLALSPHEALAGPAGRILLQPVTEIGISSTQVRDSVAQGKDIRFLVPEPVRRLILDSGCYRKES